MRHVALTSRERTQLVAAARKVARHSHSPYSKFRVGAAVLTPLGIFSGTNVENASYSLTLCAERAALAAAVAAGATTIQAVAITCIDARPERSGSGELMPCGACRQWFVELAPEATIIVDGDERTYTAGELLPSAFVLRAARATAPRSRRARRRT